MKRYGLTQERFFAWNIPSNSDDNEEYFPVDTLVEIVTDVSVIPKNFIYRNSGCYDFDERKKDYENAAEFIVVSNRDYVIPFVDLENGSILEIDERIINTKLFQLVIK